MSKKLLLPMMVVNSPTMSCCGHSRAECTCDDEPSEHDTEEQPLDLLTPEDIDDVVVNVPRKQQRGSARPAQRHTNEQPLDLMSMEDLDAEEQQQQPVANARATRKKPTPFYLGPDDALPCPGDPGYLT